ncbi:MAG: hypothetical protein Q8L60_10690 [Gammaproteobacteria bacterium]|nr:hypothetical protein [Gammaproteobacteria bacterium]MDP2346815.1 hypothetical protein [Gammaproteobacteria bacterium]
MTTPSEETEVIEATAGNAVDGEGGMAASDAIWLQRASSLFQESTDYYTASLFTRWATSASHFRSEHAPGSKYTQDAYKHRSKIFRPKPRSATRAMEATAAAALFTNNDLINVGPLDENNKLQADSGKLHKAMLQHRLEVSIPWFLTVIGAYQDTNVYGVCVSRQEWDYDVQKTTEVVPEMDEDGNPILDDDGVMLGYEQTTERVKSDKPTITLIAPENFRFDPGCDWRMPRETSPYLIEVVPLHVGKVMAMSKQRGWHDYTMAQLLAHGTERNEADPVRRARENGREDSKEVNTGNEYAMIDLHFNIIMDTDGQDWAFWTVGTGLLLSEPVPLEEYTRIGRELYAIGFSVIEAHRSHPSGTIELAIPLTELTNDVTNQRMDNVKLVLNKRYKIRKDSNIDLAALMRNTPGGGVVMGDIEKDLGTIDTPDVTQSSYAEQDRLSIETDELLGTFSQASVQSNRSLNETVGGMNLMAAGANAVQELGLRTFIETWVEPVLRTLVKLEGLFETDETILALAAGKAKIESQIDDNLLMQDLVVKVSVGMGNTDPEQKLNRFLRPLFYAKDMPEFMMEMDFLEIGKEVYALAGQGDGSRFMLTEEKKQARAAAQQGQSDPRVQVEGMRSELKQMEMEIRQAESEQDGILRQMKIEADKEVAMARIAAEQNIKMTELYERLGIEQQSLQLKSQLEQSRIQTQRDIAALKSKYDSLQVQLKAKNMANGFDSW